MTLDKKDIFLIDGTSLCYRAYYAVTGLTTSKGEPTNAVYGFVTILRRIFKDHSPENMIMTFDLPGKTERHEKYPLYKENRPPMPDDLSCQIDRIKEFVRAFGIPVVEKQGYEADDIMATLAGQAVSKGLRVTMVTADKDIFQLIGDDVRVISPKPSGDTVYDASGVMNKFGVPPEKMTDLMALMGDASDNIPGVKGVGKVTAKKLINEYGSIDGVYANIDRIQPIKLREKLIKDKENAFLSKELVVLRKDIDLGKKEHFKTLEPPDEELLKKLYGELEFTRFLKEITRADKKNQDAPKVTCSGISSDILEKAKKEKTIFIRHEGKGNYIFSFPGGDIFRTYPAKGEGADENEHKEIRKLLASPDVLKVGHDIKNEMRSSGGYGIDISMPFFDVMIAEYLIDPSVGSYSLEDIALRRDTGIQLSRTDRSKSSDGGEKLMEFVLNDDNEDACRECELIKELYPIFDKELKQKDLFTLFTDIEMPLVGVLYHMEEKGVCVDRKYLEKMSRSIDVRLSEIAAEAYDIAGEKFNINSPKQIQEILFNKLSLPSGRKIKTGSSTDEATLKRLSEKHPLPARILEYRHLSKLRSGYYDSILSFLGPDNNRLRARFNQAVTATGRLSSSEPNLQNIPVRTEEGKDVRRAFKPSIENGLILSADYSQVELRILAHLSGDKELSGAFRGERDVHSFTASKIFECDEKDVTDKMRDAAKTVNFGVIYGMGPFALAGSLGISKNEAEEFISAYFERYVGVRSFVDDTINMTRKKGYVTTLFGRRRYLPGIKSSNDRERSFAERAAVNTAVQGTAADIIKMAMIKCAKHFEQKDVRMTIQVHDELVFDVPGKEVNGIAADIKKIMESVVSLSVPLTVDIEAGPDWGSLKTLMIRT